MMEKGSSHRCCDLFSLVCIDVSNENFGALFYEALSTGFANSSSSSSHKGNFFSQAIHMTLVYELLEKMHNLRGFPEYH